MIDECGRLTAADAHANINLYNHAHSYSTLACEEAQLRNYCTTVGGVKIYLYVMRMPLAMPAPDPASASAIIYTSVS